MVDDEESEDTTMTDPEPPDEAAAATLGLVFLQTPPWNWPDVEHFFFWTFVGLTSVGLESLLKPRALTVLLRTRRRLASAASFPKKL